VKGTMKKCHISIPSLVNQAIMKNEFLLILFSAVIVELRNVCANEMIAKIIVATNKENVHFINAQKFLVHVENSLVTVQVVDFENISISENRKISVAVIHFNTFSDFTSFYEKLSPEVFHYDGYFIIIVSDFNIIDVEKIFAILWEIYIYNVIVLIDSIASNSSMVSLYTFMPFINNSCGKTKAIKINDFDIQTNRWKSETFFPAKFKNLHKCKLRIGGFENHPGFIPKTITNDFAIIEGVDSEFINSFGKILNYEPVYKMYPKSTGEIFPNKTSTGLLKRVFENEVDVIIGTLSMQQSRAKYLSETRMIYSDKMILIIPPPFFIN
jgi:hypothetical protein